MGTNLGIRYCLASLLQRALFDPINALGSFLSCRYLSTVWIHRFSLPPTGIFATAIFPLPFQKTQRHYCARMHSVNAVYIPHICSINTSTGQTPTTADPHWNRNIQQVQRSHQELTKLLYLPRLIGTVRCLLPLEGSSLNSIISFPSNLFKVIWMSVTIYAAGKVYSFY